MVLLCHSPYHAQQYGRLPPKLDLKPARNLIVLKNWPHERPDYLPNCSWNPSRGDSTIEAAGLCDGAVLQSAVPRQYFDEGDWAMGVPAGAPQNRANRVVPPQLRAPAAVGKK
jgi:hypothetical protein